MFLNIATIMTIATMLLNIVTSKTNVAKYVYSVQQ